MNKIIFAKKQERNRSCKKKTEGFGQNINELPFDTQLLIMSLIRLS